MSQTEAHWPRLHSYQGQDAFVVETLGGLRGGFFLDSGASDGVSGSNTLALERDYGWRGICVEPNATLYARLRTQRAAYSVCCCLAAEEGDVAFLEAAGVYGGIVAHYDPAFLASIRTQVLTLGDPATPLPGTLKPARTLASVLADADAPPVIDYWSLDVEGAELELLRSFPFDRYQIRVLTVEHNHMSARAKIRDLLEARGFVFARDLGIDDAYVRARRSTAWRGHWRRRARP